MFTGVASPSRPMNLRVAKLLDPPQRASWGELLFDRRPKITFLENSVASH